MARRAEFGGQRLQRIKPARGEAEDGALRCVVPRQRRTDARRGAGDEYAQRRFQRITSSWRVAS
jgi:hypothetical protein